PAALPLRIGPLAPEDVAAELLQPFRLDVSDRACIEACRLDQLGGDQPAARFFRPRARVHPELDAARAEVGASLLAFLQADVAEQAREQRAVDRAVALRGLGPRGGALPAKLLQHLLELRVQVAPFAHARVGQEVLAAQAPQPLLALQLPQ